MGRKMVLLVVVGLVFCLCGCYSTGLSPREQGGFNYSNFIYGLYDCSRAQQEEQKPLEKPIRLSVAQIGENAPPEAMLNRLQAQKFLISQAIAVPAASMEGARQGSNQQVEFSQFEERMLKMCRLSKDLGADYLLLVGGTSDFRDTQNLLSFFDITIVGGFILPSHKITVEGKASGALIDVETGRVLFSVNAQAVRSDYAPSYNVEGTTTEMFVKLRDQLVVSVADRFLEKLSVMN